MGLSLKHLCDWALLLQQKGMNMPSELDDKYFRQTFISLTQLCNQYLGLTIPIEEESKLANQMMQEILYPPYYDKKATEGLIKIQWFQLRNRIHIFKLKHRLLGVSFWGKIRGTIARIVNKD
jgi:hypothetical protein